MQDPLGPQQQQAPSPHIPLAPMHLLALHVLAGTVQLPAAAPGLCLVQLAGAFPASRTAGCTVQAAGVVLGLEELLGPALQEVQLQ